MTNLDDASGRELSDRLRAKGASDVSTYQVAYNQIDGFIDELRADHKAGAIEGGIVRLATLRVQASEGDVMRASGNKSLDLSYFDDRRSPYRRSYLSATYIARGQLVKLSVYCGVGLDEAGLERLPAGRGLTEASALALSANVNHVQRELERLQGLDVRGGTIYVDDGPLPTERYGLDEVPRDHCVTCGEEIYFSNLQWRAKSTGHAEAIVDAGRSPTGRIQKRLDHLHDPAIRDRKL